MIVKSVMDSLYTPPAEPPQDALGIRYHGPVLSGAMTLGQRIRYDDLTITGTPRTWSPNSSGPAGGNPASGQPFLAVHSAPLQL
jgi:hypothetical protein